MDVGRKWKLRAAALLTVTTAAAQAQVDRLVGEQRHRAGSSAPASPAVAPSPTPSASAKSDKDIVVVGKRRPLKDGEWLFTLSPPRPVDVIESAETTGIVPAWRPRTWRVCLVRGDMLRMMYQLAQVSARPATAKGRRPLGWMRCRPIQVSTSGGRVWGVQSCTQFNFSSVGMGSSPLGGFVTADFRIDGRYSPDKFFMSFSSEVESDSDPWIAASSTRRSVRPRLGNTLQGKRIGECVAQSPAGTEVVLPRNEK